MRTQVEQIACPRGAPDPRQRFIPALIGFTLMSLGFLATVAFADRKEWEVPWYFVQEVTVGAAPMFWLLYALRSRLLPEEKKALAYTSAFFVALAYVLESVALNNRYWWFYQGNDRLLGLEVAGIPIEELIYYPLLLSTPVLLYIYWQKRLRPAKEALPWPRAARYAATILAITCIGAGLGLLVRSLSLDGPPLDLSLEPSPDGSGLVRYATGPASRGWSIVQLVSLGIAILLYQRLRQRVHRSALLVSLMLYFLFALLIEVTACTRGWWVWNAQQVSGVFTHVIPLDSYVMYLTGCVLPVLLYESLVDSGHRVRISTRESEP